MFKNRTLPLFLSVFQIIFWLCYRYSASLTRKYYFLKLLENNSVRIFMFVLLGFTLAWTFYAFSDKLLSSVLAAAALGGILILIMYAYNRIYRHSFNKDFFRFKWTSLTGGIIAGCLLFGLVCVLFSEKKEGISYSLASLSVQRNSLMGIAMLYIMVFHTLNMGSVYTNDTVRMIINRGYSGVDVFLFLSGIGMVYSLSKNFNVLNFYKKRLLRIYPSFIPVAAIYSLVCFYMGKCGINMLFINCSGFYLWITNHTCAFNWYVSALILFYLLAPLFFVILRNAKWRLMTSSALLVVSLFFYFASTHFMNLSRFQVVFTRFPIFILGMIIGFLLLEKVSFNRGEYISLFISMIIGIVFMYIMDSKKISLTGWHWIAAFFVFPAMCLFVGDFLQKTNAAKSFIGKFLDWTGKNSLLIYLFNILIGSSSACVK